MPFTTSQHMDGVLGGGQIGYNWQFNRSWVLGLEADIQGTGQRGTATYPPFVVPPGGALLVVPGFTSTATLTQKLPWFGTVRARLGVEPSSNWLLYVTGGLAYGRQVRSTLKHQRADDHAASRRRPRPASTTTAPDGRPALARSGCSHTSGARKLEYLYMDYGHISDGFIGTGSFATVAINSHVTDNVVRAGVNYHFH